MVSRPRAAAAGGAEAAARVGESAYRAVEAALLVTLGLVLAGRAQLARLAVVCGKAAACVPAFAGLRSVRVWRLFSPSPRAFPVHQQFAAGFCLSGSTAQ